MKLEPQAPGLRRRVQGTTLGRGRGTHPWVGRSGHLRSLATRRQPVPLRVGEPVTDLQTILLAAMVAFRLPGPEDRYWQVANAVAAAAEARPVFGTKPNSVRDTALLVLAIYQHESGLLPEVRDCQRKGNGGRSVGLGQLMRGRAWHGHSEEEVCTSTPSKQNLPCA